MRSLDFIIWAYTCPQEERFRRMSQSMAINSLVFTSYNSLFLFTLSLIHNFIQFRDLILTRWRDDDILSHLASVQPRSSLAFLECVSCG